MADSTESNSKGVQYLVPALISVIAGLVIHSFIIGVNVTDWWKRRSVTPVDHIVTLLGISRMCAQCQQPLYFFFVTFFQGNLDSHVIQFFIAIIYSFFTYANIWLTSLLSIVLCLKISNLHTRLFLYLRKMILHRTVHFIVAALIFAALYGLMQLWMTIISGTNGEVYNSTMHNLFGGCVHIDIVYIFTIGTLFPLLFYSISSVLLFTFLYHHTTRMKMSSNLSINLETYYSLMRFVSFTFLYNTIYFISHFLCAFYYYFHCVELPRLYIVLNFLPILHSSYLIYRTAKLRNQMSKVLHNVIDFLFQRKDTETRENIEVVDLSH